MKYFSLLFIFLFSCGGKISIECENIYVTSGIQVCTEEGLKVDSKDIDLIVKILEEETQKYYFYMKDFSKIFEEEEVVVHFIDGNLSLNCKTVKSPGNDLYSCEDWVSGVNYDGWSIYVEYYSCLGISPLGHELLHTIEYYYFGDAPQDHSTGHFFTQHALECGDPVEDTIEYRTEKRSVDEIEECEEYRDYYEN
jgi:hypothetical protein